MGLTFLEVKIILITPSKCAHISISIKWVTFSFHVQIFHKELFTLVNVYVDLLVFTCIAATS